MNDPADTPAKPPTPALAGTAAPEMSFSAWTRLLDSAGQWLVVKDATQGRYRCASQAWCQRLGCDEQDVLGKRDLDLMDAGVGAALAAADAAAIAHDGPLRTEHVIEIAGRRLDLAATRMRFLGPGAEVLLGIVWTDVTDAHRAQAALAASRVQIEQQQGQLESLRREISEQPQRDLATGLHARSHFDEQLRREVDLSLREHREFAVVFIECDALTSEPAAAVHGAVFDALGRLLKGGTRAMDASCRWDERRLAVLLSGVGLATAHARMEGLRRQCATQIVMQGGLEHRFTVAMGVASFPHTAGDGESLIAAGQAALLEAQRRGGNQVTLASIRLDIR